MLVRLWSELLVNRLVRFVLGSSALLSILLAITALLTGCGPAWMVFLFACGACPWLALLSIYFAQALARVAPKSTKQPRPVVRQPSRLIAS